GYLLTETGRAEEADQHHRQALKLFQELASEDPQSASYADGQGMSYSGLSAVHFKAGRLAEAEDCCRRAVNLYQKLAARADPWYRFKLAEERGNLGEILAAAGRPAEAESAFREAQAGQEKLADQFPTVVRHRQAAAQAAVHLARLLTATARYQEAGEAY